MKAPLGTFLIDVWQAWFGFKLAKKRVLIFCCLGGSIYWNL